MKTTLREFIKQISNVKEELLDKEIIIIGENGLELRPIIKYIPNDNLPFDFDSKCIDKILITY